MAETALITYRDYAGGGIQIPQTAPMNLPLPASYTAPVVFFGALALVPSQGQHVAGLVGWGIVVATLLNLWDPKGKVKSQAPAPTPSTGVAGQPGGPSLTTAPGTPAGSLGPIGPVGANG